MDKCNCDIMLNQITERSPDITTNSASHICQFSSKLAYARQEQNHINSNAEASTTDREQETGGEDLNRGPK